MVVVTLPTLSEADLEQVLQLLGALRIGLLEDRAELSLRLRRHAFGTRVLAHHLGDELCLDIGAHYLLGALRVDGSLAAAAQCVSSHAL